MFCGHDRSSIQFPTTEHGTKAHSAVSLGSLFFCYFGLLGVAICVLARFLLMRLRRSFTHSQCGSGGKFLLSLALGWGVWEKGKEPAFLSLF